MLRHDYHDCFLEETEAQRSQVTVPTSPSWAGVLTQAVHLQTSALLRPLLGLMYFWELKIHKERGTGVPAVVQDLALPQLWCKSQLQLRFEPWPGNFHILWVQPKKKKKKKKRKEGEHVNGRNKFLQEAGVNVQRGRDACISVGSIL